MFTPFMLAVAFFGPLSPVAPFTLFGLFVTLRFREQCLVGELELAGLGVHAYQLDLYHGRPP